MPAVSDPSLSYRKALLVASGPVMLEKLARPLKEAGMQVSACDSFADARELFQDQALIILPFREQAEEAVAFVNWLRKASQPSVYIVAVGRCEESERRGLAARLRLNDVICLPCSEEEIRERLGSYRQWCRLPENRVANGGGRPLEDALAPADLNLTGRVSLFADAGRTPEEIAALEENELPEVIYCREAPVGIALFDRDFRYLLANPRWRQQFRLGDRDIIGKTQFEVFPSLHPAWSKIYRKCLGGETRRGREVLSAAHGPVEMRWEVRPWEDRSGHIGGIIIAFEEAWTPADERSEPASGKVDAPEAVSAEATPAEAPKAPAADPFEEIAAPVVRIGLDGRIRRANDAAVALSAVNLENLADVSVAYVDAFPAQGVEEFAAALQALRLGSTDGLPLSSLEGGLEPGTHLAWSNTVERNARGEAESVLRVGVELEDVFPLPGAEPVTTPGQPTSATDESPAVDSFEEADLDKREELIWKADAEGEITFFNRAWLAYRGREADAEKEGGWLDGLHPDDARQTTALIARVVTEHERIAHRFRLKDASGAYRDFRSWLVPLSEDPKGEWSGFAGICRPAEADRAALRDETVASRALEERAERAETKLAALQGTGDRKLWETLHEEIVDESLPAAHLDAAEISRLVAERLPQWRAARKQLRDELQTFREIFDQVAIGIVLLDEKGEAVFSNRRHAELLGFRIDEAGGMEGWLQRACPDAEHAEAVLETWREEIWRRQLTKVLALTNEARQLREIEIRPQLFVDGDRLLLTLQDVTDAKRSEDALRDSDLRFRALFRDSAIGIALIDPAGNVCDVNPVLERMLGVPRRRMLCQPFDAYLEDEDVPRKAALCQKLHDSPRRSGSLEVRLRPQGVPEDEGPLWVRLHVSLVRDADRQLLFTAFHIHDIREQKQIQTDLQVSQEQNRALLEAIPDLIMLVDREGVVVDFLPSEDMPENASEEETIGRRIDELIPAFTNRFKGLVDEAYRLDDAVLFQYDLRDGEARGRYRARIVACKPDGAVVTIQKTDREAKPALDAEPRRQAWCFAASPSPVMLAASDGEVIDWNAAAETFFGYPRDQALGQPLPKLFGVDTFDELVGLLDRQGDGAFEGRLKFWRQDGSGGECEVVIKPMDAEAAESSDSLQAVFVREVDAPSGLAASEAAKVREACLARVVPHMHQRLRNNLQVIGSLLNLQTRAQRDPVIQDTLLVARNRVVALNLLHEQVDTRSEDEAVDFGAFARKLADELLASHHAEERIEILVSAEARLDLQIASPLALILNELLSNAIQHAFPTLAKGTVRVHLHLQEGTGILAVSDNGVYEAPSSPSDAPRLGFQIVQTLARQIGGNLKRIDSTETEFRVYFATSLRK